MPLTLNFVKDSYKERPSLQRYLTYLFDHGPRLVIANTIPESKVAQMRTVRWADTINEVNGEKVRTLADLRSALQKSKETGTIVLRTTDELLLNTANVLTVMSLQETCEETEYLSEIHTFPISETMQHLIDSFNEGLAAKVC
jgi:S1-C subfamily serine protease